MSGVDLVEQGINIKNLKLDLKDPTEQVLYKGLNSEFILNNLEGNEFYAALLIPNIHNYSKARNQAEILLNILPNPVTTDAIWASTDPLSTPVSSYLKDLLEIKSLNPDLINENNIIFKSEIEEQLKQTGFSNLSNLNQLVAYKFIYPEKDIKNEVEKLFILNTDIIDFKFCDNPENFNYLQYSPLDFFFNLKLLNPSFFKHLDFKSTNLFQSAQLELENLINNSGNKNKIIELAAKLRILEAKDIMVSNDGINIIDKNNNPHVAVMPKPLERSFE